MSWKNRNQWIIIACVLLLLVSLFLLVLYKYRITLKNEYILNQQKGLVKQIRLYKKKEFAVKGLKGDILNIRENILRSSAVYKKIIKKLSIN